MSIRRTIQLCVTPHVRNYCGRKMKETQTLPLKDRDETKSRTLSGRELPKNDPVFQAIGATEELLSTIGLAREYAQESEHEYCDKLKRIQTIIIDLSTKISRCEREVNSKIGVQYTKELEDWIAEYAKQLTPPEQYIIPGSGIASASLHLARSICRRAEREVVPLVRDKYLDKEIVSYLNKLSDFLLTVSRVAAKLDKRTESIYIPKPDEKVQEQ